MKKLWLKDITTQSLKEAEVGDWVEGFGDIQSHSERQFIRRIADWLPLFQVSKDCFFQGGHGCGNIRPGIPWKD